MHFALLLILVKCYGFANAVAADPFIPFCKKNDRAFKGKPGRYHCFNLSGGAYQYIPPPAAAAAAAAAFAAAASSFFSAMSDSVVSTIAATEEAF